MIREQIVAEARSWLGVPYRHQGRDRDTGVDCIGLVIVVAKALNLVDAAFDVSGYSRVPDGSSLMRLASANMTRTTLAEAKAGDILVVSFGAEPQHFAILYDHPNGGLGIIHAAMRNRKVIENRLVFSSVMKFIAVFKLPGA